MSSKLLNGLRNWGMGKSFRTAPIEIFIHSDKGPARNLHVKLQPIAILRFIHLHPCQSARKNSSKGKLFDADRSRACC